MTDSRLDALMAADTRLSRTFVVAVIAALASLFWTLFIASPEQARTPDGVGLVLAVVQFGSYVWYAMAAGGAAKVLGDPGWRYVAWIIAAPFLAKLPIPIVSTLIAVSPLSIKFLLGSQLQSAIRQESNIHHQV
jgi:hypothetical protein